MKREPGNECRDESLGLRLDRDLLVVVDDEPAFVRPDCEILAQDLGKRLDVLSRGGKRPEVLTQAKVTPLDERLTCPSETEGEPCDVSGGRARREPGSASSVASHPLLGERRLTVSGRRDEGSNAGPRVVQEREEPRPLDDPAASEDASFLDCRRRRHPLAAVA